VHSKPLVNASTANGAAATLITKPDQPDRDVLVMVA
jgi:hypothetical protein